MLGVLFATLGGLFVSLQNVFNTRISDKVGFIEATAVVHLVGLVFAIAAVILFGKGNLRNVTEVNKIYLLAGFFGVMIIFNIMKGISYLGTTYAVAIVIISQLTFATIIDTFGLFGMPQIKLVLSKPIGILIMIAGIIVFNLKG
ncbi:MAG: DMT family transporter [Bacillota bacterium]|nr:DMT family transporter [Bacillota bacterium]